MHCINFHSHTTGIVFGTPVGYLLKCGASIHVWAKSNQIWNWRKLKRHHLKPLLFKFKIKLGYNFSVWSEFP
jgi:hypothetical protein